MKRKLTKKMVAFGLAAAVVATNLTPVPVSAKKPVCSTDYSNPKNWNVRHTDDDIYSMFSDLEKTYPKYAKLSSIGKTTKKMTSSFLLLQIRNQRKKTKQVLLS